MTQLLIKRNTTNLIKNPRFNFTNRNNWNEYNLGLVDADGNFLRCDPLNADNLVFNKLGTSNETLFTISQSDIDILPNASYTVKIELDNTTRENPSLDNFQVNVYVGGTYFGMVDSDGSHILSGITSNIDELTIEVNAQNNLNVYTEIKYVQLYKNDTNYEIDLYNEIPFEITYQTSDLRDVSTKKGSFTQTIKIPATDNNNKVFGHIGIIEVDSKFLVTKKTQVYILQNGTQVFEGNLQFMNATKDNGKVTEYEIKISSDAKDVRDDWGDDTLSTLDFSELNHLFNITNLYDNIINNKYLLNNVSTNFLYTASTASFSDTFYNFSSGATNGLLGLTFGSPHGFVEGDVINVTLNDNQYNPDYEQQWTILSANSNNIILNKGFGNSTTGESGRAYKTENLGQGYVFGRIHRGDISRKSTSTPTDYNGYGGVGYSVDDFKPNLNLKYVVDKIFSQYGYSYSSTTMSTNFFKNIYLEHSFDKALRADNLNGEYDFEATAPSEYKYWRMDNNNPVSPTDEQLFFSNEVFDGGSNYDSTLSIHTPANTELYTLEADLNILAELYPQESLAWGMYFGLQNTCLGLTAWDETYDVGVRINISLVEYNTATTVTRTIQTDTIEEWIQQDPDFTFPNASGSHKVFVDELYKFKVTDVFSTDCQYSIHMNALWLKRRQSNGTETDIFGADFDVPDFEVIQLYDSGGSSCTGGDGIFRQVGQISNHRDIVVRIEADSSFYSIHSTSIVENSIIDFNSLLPSNVKIVDFFDSLCKQFNLQFQKEDTKLYRIETYDEWYAQGSTLNWSDKLDINQLTVTPTSALQPNKFIFKGTAGSDYWNIQTSANIIKDSEGNERQYGQLEILTDNQWNKETLEISTIFTPTVITDYKGNSDGGYYSDGLVIPRIISSLGSTEVPDEGIRLLYYNKNIDTTGFFVYSVITEVGELIYYYNSLSHVNDPYIPTVDLNWTSPAITWYPVNRWTDNNLFNKFYYSYINDLLDINSKLLTGKIYLNINDIANIDMRDIIVIDNNKFRINKIVYSTTFNGLAQIELITI